MPSIDDIAASMASTRERDARSLPVELLQPIFEQLLLPSDLLHLLRVSKTFHRESERALYRYLKFNSPPDFLRFGVLEQLATRPSAAQSVHTLDFRGLSCNAWLLPLIKHLSAALRSTLNLKALLLPDQSTADWRDELDTFLPINAPFRLQRLDIGHQRDAAIPKMLDFLITQDRIEDLGARTKLPSKELPKNSLPFLKTLRANSDDISDLAIGRPLTRLYCRGPPPFGIRNLRTLYLLQAQYLPIFKASFPTLRLLVLGRTVCTQPPPPPLPSHPNPDVAPQRFSF